MRKKDLRKLQKKRKAKQKQGNRKPAVLAYRGNKYRTEELVRLILDTETAVYECFVITKRRLTDHDVRSALQTLVMQIRKGLFSPQEDVQSQEGVADGEVEFVIWNVRGRWHHFFERHPCPGRDKLIGVLRTILGSIEVRGSIDRNSRGYLEYIEEFLGKVGVSVEEYSSEAEVAEALHDGHVAPPLES